MYITLNIIIPMCLGIIIGLLMAILKEIKNLNK